MPKFKIATPAGTTYGGPGATYDYELEALRALDVEVVEIAAKDEAELKPLATSAGPLSGLPTWLKPGSAARACDRCRAKKSGPLPTATTTTTPRE